MTNIPKDRLDAKTGRVRDDLRVRSFLIGIEKIKLADLIRADYDEKKMLDADYAKYAAETLGFSITEANLRGIRKDLGIESTYDRNVRAAKEEREARKAQRAAEDAAAKQSKAAVVKPAPVPEDADIQEIVDAAVQRAFAPFEQRQNERSASTTHQIDRQNSEVAAALRAAEAAKRDAALAREQVADVTRKYVALQETVKQELEKIQGRMRLLTQAAGSVLTQSHPNGHPPAPNGKHA